MVGFRGSRSARLSGTRNFNPASPAALLPGVPMAWQSRFSGPAALVVRSTRLPTRLPHGERKQRLFPCLTCALTLGLHSCHQLPRCPGFPGQASNTCVVRGVIACRFGAHPQSLVPGRRPRLQCRLRFPAFVDVVKHGKTRHIANGRPLFYAHRPKNEFMLQNSWHS